jgi:hypothetical protein
MKHITLGMLVGAAVFAAAGIAQAQQSTRIIDGNNPAPNYPNSATGKNLDKTARIMDGNNPSPNYPNSATGKNLDKQSRIMDGNNPSPNYPASAKQTAAPHRHAKKKS